MARLMKSELRKLVTTRTAAGLAVGAVAVAVLAVIGTGAQAAVELERPLREQQWFLLSGMLVRVFIVVLAIRVVTDEFQHGTIVPTVLLEPRRERVVAAKLLTGGGVGLVVAAVAQAALLAAAAVTGARYGVALEVTLSDLPVVVGPVVAGVLWGVIGAAFGSAVRAQTPAIVAAVVWLLGLEDLVGSRLGEIAEVLPARAGLSLALARDAGMLGEVAAILSLYAAAAGVAALLWFRRRDVA